MVGIFDGALRYSHYGFVKRYLMKKSPRDKGSANTAWWAQRIDSPRDLWWARDPVPFAVCSSGITVARGAHDAVSKLDHPPGEK
jgi:hypothetical protein